RSTARSAAGECPTGKLMAELKVPLPCPNRTLISLLPWFTVATSILPSRLKSPVTTATGLLPTPAFLPTAKPVGGTKLGSVRSCSPSKASRRNRPALAFRRPFFRAQFHQARNMVAGLQMFQTNVARLLTAGKLQDNLRNRESSCPAEVRIASPSGPDRLQQPVEKKILARLKNWKNAQAGELGEVAVVPFGGNNVILTEALPPDTSGNENGLSGSAN